jgi:hypothetical protein
LERLQHILQAVTGLSRTAAEPEQLQRENEQVSQQFQIAQVFYKLDNDAALCPWRALILKNLGHFALKIFNGGAISK